MIDATTRDALIARDPKSAELIKPLLGGEEIRRFVTRPKSQFIIVLPAGWTRKQASPVALQNEETAWAWFQRVFPALGEHLYPFAATARKRQDKGDFWWELRSCAYYSFLERSKIIFPDIAKGPRFVIDTDGHYLTNTAYCLGTDSPYLLGILNSRLFWFAISNISIPFGVRAGEYRYRLIYQYMEKVPIRPIDFSNPTEKASHDRMVQLVEQMLSLHKQLPVAKTGHDQTHLQRQIDATDRQIDRLVFELYGLTAEEIAVVEGV